MNESTGIWIMDWMSAYEIIQKPLCYATLKNGDHLILCNNCKCAWYSSEALRDEHSSHHRPVCNLPDYIMVNKLSLDQCYNMITDSLTIGSFDHNTAAVFIRFYSLARDEGHKKQSKRSDCAKCLNDISFELRELLRSCQKRTELITKAWSCPGIPQVIMFLEMQSLTFEGLRLKYPEGRPIFNTLEDDLAFDRKFNTHYDTSGDWIGCFIIHFLLFSVVDCDTDCDIVFDGRGKVLSSPRCDASILRIGGIMSNYILRNSLKEALYPIPGLLSNIAENYPQKFSELLKLGIFPGILEWADQDFAFKSIEIIAKPEVLKTVDEMNITLILTECCHALDYPPWQKTSEGVQKSLTDCCRRIISSIFNLDSICLSDLLLRGIEQKSKHDIPCWKGDECFGQKRMVLAYFYEIINHRLDKISSEDINRWLDDWLDKSFDRTKYALKVMLSTDYDKWLLKCEYSRQHQQKGLNCEHN